MATPASCCIHLNGRYQTPSQKREPTVGALKRRPHLAALPLLPELKTNIWHPSETRLGARGQREGNVFLLGHSSVPGCHSGEDRSGSGRQYPCYLPGTPIPEIQGLLQYEALSCTYIVRSKVTVKAAAGKRHSPGLWKLLFNFLSSFKLGSHLPPPHP